MTYLLVSPEIVGSVAADAESIGAALASGNAATAGATTGMTSAAADEVSTAIAALFSQYALDYQVLAADADALHDQFTRSLMASAISYAVTEAADAALLQALAATPWQAVVHDALGVINTPTQVLLGRPLIGNGTNGAPGTGKAGGSGGILFGSGGTGGSGVPGAPGMPGGAGGRGGDRAVRQRRDWWGRRGRRDRHGWCGRCRPSGWGRRDRRGGR